MDLRRGGPARREGRQSYQEFTARLLRAQSQANQEAALACHTVKIDGPSLRDGDSSSG